MLTKRQAELLNLLKKHPHEITKWMNTNTISSCASRGYITLAIYKNNAKLKITETGLAVLSAKTFNFWDIQKEIKEIKNKYV